MIVSSCAASNCCRDQGHRRQAKGKGHASAFLQQAAPAIANTRGYGMPRLGRASCPAGYAQSGELHARNSLPFPLYTGASYPKEGTQCSEAMKMQPASARLRTDVKTRTSSWPGYCNLSQGVRIARTLALPQENENGKISACLVARRACRPARPGLPVYSPVETPEDVHGEIARRLSCRGRPLRQALMLDA